MTALHSRIEEEVTSSATVDVAPLTFEGFELFPPGKMNLIVARFVAPQQLRRLRDSVWRTCLEHGVAIKDDDEWMPHVTLGKLSATKSQVSRVSCRQLTPLAQSMTKAPRQAMTPLGLTLLGSRPKQAWLDWDEALAFVARPDESDDEHAPAAGPIVGAP